MGKQNQTRVLGEMGRFSHAESKRNDALDGGHAHGFWQEMRVRE